jgi:hypothetical protein
LTSTKSSYNLVLHGLRPQGQVIFKIKGLKGGNSQICPHILRMHPPTHGHFSNCKTQGENFNVLKHTNIMRWKEEEALYSYKRHHTPTTTTSHTNRCKVSLFTFHKFTMCPFLIIVNLSKCFKKGIKIKYQDPMFV